MFNNFRRISGRTFATMSLKHGAVKTGIRNGKPYAEIVIRPLDGYDCDRSGYIPLNKLSAFVFPNRGRIYRKVPANDPYAEMFRSLNQVNTQHFSFITTTRTQVDDNLYASKWRRGLGDNNILLRVQLLHVGRTSYSVVNELAHDDDHDHKLAKLVHHVTMVDKTTHRPVPLPEEFVASAQDWALESKLPYNVVLSTQPEDVHRYKTVIRWTDTDFYQHLNTTVYMKYAMDAIYDAVSAGKLKEHLSDTGHFRVKDFLMRFIRQSLQGQEVEMLLWVGPEGTVNLRMFINDIVVNESLLAALDYNASEPLKASL